MKKTIAVIAVWATTAALFAAVVITAVTNQRALQPLTTEWLVSTTQTAPLQVNLNTATAEELMEIPHIGEATAEKIIGYRERCGGFRSVDDLRDIEGIGEKRIEEWKAYFIV